MSNLSALSTRGRTMAQTAVKTGNYTANDFEIVLCDTSAGAFSVTLPPSPVADSQVHVVDVGNSFSAYNLTISRNGKNIANAADDFVCDVSNSYIKLRYNTTKGWLLDTMPNTNAAPVSDVPEIFVTSKSADQTGMTGSGGVTKVTWKTTPDIDLRSGWDSVNNRYVVQATGYYQIIASCRFTGNGINNCRFFVNKNNGTYILSSDGDLEGQLIRDMTASGIVYLAAGDTLEITVVNYSNASTGVSYNDTGTRWQIARLMTAAGSLYLPASAPGGRLTLASGDPYYDPQNTVAVSGQDTVNDLITVTAHGWSVGTMVVSSATSGGITAATTYYVGNVTTNTISLHTTLAAAIAGTSKLDITGAVTANITAFGVANQTLYYTPAVSNQISLWDGTRWNVRTFAEVSIALGTLTGSIGYDVFAYDNNGAVTLELLAWTSATARATAVTLQDGRWCKSGAKTRLLLGSFYTRDTTSTESSSGGAISQVGGKRFLDNIYNNIQLVAYALDRTNTWSYTTATVRQANGAAGNKTELFCSVPKLVSAKSFSVVTVFNTASSVYTGIGVDSTTVISSMYTEAYTGASANINIPMHSELCTTLLGYHYLAWLESGCSTGTSTFKGDNGLDANPKSCGVMQTINM